VKTSNLLGETGCPKLGALGTPGTLRFNPRVLESVHTLAPELWFGALGVSMPPALTLPLTCNAASRKPRADCGSHGAPLRTCVLHLDRPYEDRCAWTSAVSASVTFERASHTAGQARPRTPCRSMTGRDSEMRRAVPSCAEMYRAVPRSSMTGRDSEMLPICYRDMPRCAEMCLASVKERCERW